LAYLEARASLGVSGSKGKPWRIWKQGRRTSKGKGWSAGFVDPTHRRIAMDGAPGNDPLFADKLEAIVGLYLNPTRTPNPSSGLQKLATSSKRSPALRPHSINDDLRETLH
jgi:hypothetical protein